MVHGPYPTVDVPPGRERRQRVVIRLVDLPSGGEGILAERLVNLPRTQAHSSQLLGRDAGRKGAQGDLDAPLGVPKVGGLHPPLAVLQPEASRGRVRHPLVTVFYGAIATPCRCRAPRMWILIFLPIGEEIDGWDRSDFPHYRASSCRCARRACGFSAGSPPGTQRPW